MNDWSSVDAISARKHIVRGAKITRVEVQQGTGFFVRISKSEAYRLLGTGQFSVSAGDDYSYADLSMILTCTNQLVWGRG